MKKGVPNGAPSIFIYNSGLDCVSKLSTGLKLGNLLCSNLDLLLCGGVDTLTSWALAYTECTETNERHFVTLYECILNSYYCCVESLFGVCL